jgi:hypothetical protein
MPASTEGEPGKHRPSCPFSPLGTTGSCASAMAFAANVTEITDFAISTPRSAITASAVRDLLHTSKLFHPPRA